MKNKESILYKFYSIITTKNIDYSLKLLFLIKLIPPETRYKIKKFVKHYNPDSYKKSIKIKYNFCQRCRQIARIKPYKNSFLIIPPAESYGSFGDQAMMLALINELKNTYKNPKFGIIKYANEYEFPDFDNNFEKYLTDVEVFPLGIKEFKLNYYSIKNFLEILNNYNNVIVVGADVMDGAYSMMLLQVFEKFLYLTHKTKRKSSVLGFSYNGLNNPKIIKILKSVSKYARLNIRDEISYKRLKKVGVKGIYLTSDMAFLYNPAYLPLQDRTKELLYTLEDKKKNGKKFIGINLKLTKNNEQKEEQIFNEIAKSLDNLDKNVYELILLPQDVRWYYDQYSDVQSLEMYNEKFKRTGFTVHLASFIQNQSESKILAQLCDFVITCRMHLAIAALSQGIPPISFIYQGKFEGLYKMYNFDKKLYFERNSFSQDEFSDAVKYVSENCLALSKHINKKNEMVFALAKKNLKM